MLEQLKILVKLQELDKELYTLNGEAEAIPQKLNELGGAAESLGKKLEANEADLAEMSERKKDMETESEEIKSRIRRSEQRLMAAQGQREYRAATAEIEEGKDSLKAIDDQLIEVMEHHENLETKVNQLKEMHAEAAKAYKEQKSGLEKQASKLKTAINKLEKSRGGLTKGVAPDLMSQYDFIRKNRQGVALAPVSNCTCLACHMQLPPQQFNELQRMDKIMSCPSCRRLIYWADAEALNEDK